MRWSAILPPLALGALIALQLLLTRLWLDLIDEGYFAELADRVTRGELPYRDFATVYTPGVHYLHAWTFGLLGRDLVSLRLILVAAKASLAVLLYVLGRRLMPPPFALLPVVLLLAIDTAPVMWEPHPAWYALLFALACVWCLTRLLETGADHWTLLVGGSAALSCAFKQNIGLFIMLAVAGFLLFHSADLPSGWARLPLPRCATRRVCLAARLCFAVAALGALTWLIRAYLDPRLAAVFLLPAVAAAGAGLIRGVPASETHGQREAAAGRIVWLGGTFLLVTLLWAVPLILAVGPANLPLGQFVGALDLTGFYWELAEPRLGFGLLLVAAGAAPAGVLWFCRPASHRRRLLGGVAFLLLAALAIDLAIVDIALATPDFADEEPDLWRISVRAAETVLLYLPSLSFWGAVLAYASAGPALGSLQRLTVRWYLFAGTLLLFNLYPRMDTMHVTFSGPLLLVPGAFALHCLYRAMKGRMLDSRRRSLQRGLLFGSLLILPLTAALPNVEWRASSLLEGNLVPFEVAGANVLLPAASRDAIGGAARYLREHTAPDEPIFVYPTLPMFYYLADRPNATRFAHVYPGAATLEEQEDMIRSLETNQVRYVLWDQFWVNEWAIGGRHVLNQPLTDYLLQAYHTETMVGPFHILARTQASVRPQP